MPAPKTPDRIRSTGRLRKLECFEPLGGCGTIIYASRGAIARSGLPSCGCGRAFEFSRPEDCLTDDDRAHHPLVLDDQAREYRAAIDAEREHRAECEACGTRAPLGHRETWRCGHCGYMHTVAADGDAAGCYVSPGTGEWEESGERDDLTSSAPRIHYPRNGRQRIAAAPPAPAHGLSKRDAGDDLPF